MAHINLRRSTHRTSARGKQISSRDNLRKDERLGSKTKSSRQKRAVRSSSVARFWPHGKSSEAGKISFSRSSSKSLLHDATSADRSRVSARSRLRGRASEGSRTSARSSSRTLAFDGSRTSGRSRLRASDRRNKTGGSGRTIASQSFKNDKTRRTKRGILRQSFSGSGRRMSRLFLLLGILGGLALLCVGTVFILSLTPLFTIDSIDAEETSHVSGDTITKLAQVKQGTTLLNVNTDNVASRVKKNPWVESVSVQRIFPNKLKVSVVDRKVFAVVLMNSGTIAWYLSSDGVWIEPINLTLDAKVSAANVARQTAESVKALLISDMPLTVMPKAGAPATDGVIKAIRTYHENFSSDFSHEVLSYNAASEENVVCTLKSGVVLALGAPKQISLKEQVIKRILSEHPNQVTYINVHVPAKPSYRRLDSDQVQQGSGSRSTT